MSSPTLVTAEELAEILRVHVNTVYSLARTHRIPSIKAGRRYLFDLSRVSAALEVKEGRP